MKGGQRAQCHHQQLWVPDPALCCLVDKLAADVCDMGHAVPACAEEGQAVGKAPYNQPVAPLHKQTPLCVPGSQVDTGLSLQSARNPSQQHGSWAARATCSQHRHFVLWSAQRGSRGPQLSCMPCRLLKDCNTSAGLHSMQLGPLMSCMPCRLLRAPRSWLACTTCYMLKSWPWPACPRCSITCHVFWCVVCPAGCQNPSAMACLHSISPPCLTVPACPAGR